MSAERLERAQLALRAGVRDVPDFPSPGVGFKDIAPLLSDPSQFETVLDGLHALVEDTDADLVAGIESRGFVLAAPLALRLRRGFVLIRKAGKLPGPTRRVSYHLEYGSAVLEVQAGALDPSVHGRAPRVVLVDDVLATGGTAAAAADLVGQAGGVVAAVAVLIELSGLRGEALAGYDIRPLLRT